MVSFVNSKSQFHVTYVEKTSNFTETEHIGLFRKV